MKKEINIELWKFNKIKQIHTSSITSINSNKMPKTIKIIENYIQQNQKWADIGGGKFDNLKEYFSKKGAELFIYDPFNRTKNENENTVLNIANGQCDGVMINNVLNVVDSREGRIQIINQAFDCLKDNSCAYFKIYEGNKTGEKTYVSKKDGSSVQLNQKTEFYLNEIKEVFGQNVHKKSEFIYAIKSPILNNNFNYLISQAVKLGVPNRSKKYGFGKQMGDDLYIHKNYSSILPKDYKEYLSTLELNAPNFDFQIIKYNSKKNQYSFIKSPDFDFSPEPIIGDIIVIDNQKNLKFISPKKDPQIYHHKWVFVADNYQGFSIKESIERSISWKSKIGNNKEISSRIGTKSFWDNLLKDINIVDNKPKPK